MTCVEGQVNSTKIHVVCILILDKPAFICRCWLYEGHLRLQPSSWLLGHCCKTYCCITKD